MRLIVEAIFYVYCWFARFRETGTWETINHYLVIRDREQAGRPASPTAGMLYSQNVKAAEAGGPRGYGAGKKANGRKSHALVDTDGRARSSKGCLLTAAMLAERVASVTSLRPWGCHRCSLEPVAGPNR